MGRTTVRIGTALFILFFIAAPSFAQSSGNFASQILTPQCEVNADKNGKLQANVGCLID